MIVVDRSVWIARLRGLKTPQTTWLAGEIGHTPVIVGDLILAEVLQGVPTEAHAIRLEAEFRTNFLIMPMVGADLAVSAARLYRQLRGRGVTIGKTIDMLIGAFCIASGFPLLHDDRDFDPMETFLGLRVVR